MRAYESTFKVQLTMLDWDKLLSNDHVGDAGFMEVDLMADTPQRDEGTGLYGEEVDGGQEMKEFSISLLSSSGKDAVPWEAKHNPVITFR
jgi:phosphatidylserine decarboxylase